SHHLLEVHDDRPVTHVKLNIYPDGGVARLRIYGEVRPNPEIFGSGKSIDLFALEHGGRALVCSDEHFGSMHNLNIAGRGSNMGDGWETARRRGPGNDWVVLALGHPGTVERIVIDTAHFKGNYPDRARIQAASAGDARLEELVAASEHWPVLLATTKLGADREHVYARELEAVGPVSHLRLSIYPDGGVSRLRVYGRRAGMPPAG